MLSLRQAGDGSQPNKMYVKVEVDKGGPHAHCLTMTLLEFRLWGEEMRRVGGYLE